MATAIISARRGWENAEVWERLGRPAPSRRHGRVGDPDRSYNVGVSGRGQIALEKLGACERVLQYCKRVNGRMDWSPQNPNGVTRESTEKKYATQVIQRDRLVATLLEEIEEKYSDKVTVFHDRVRCVRVAPGGGATLTREPAERIEKLDEDPGAAATTAGGARRRRRRRDENAVRFKNAARARGGAVRAVRGGRGGRDAAERGSERRTATAASA